MGERERSMRNSIRCRLKSWFDLRIRRGAAAILELATHLLAFSEWGSFFFFVFEENCFCAETAIPYWLLHHCCHSLQSLLSFVFWGSSDAYTQS